MLPSGSDGSPSSTSGCRVIAQGQRSPVCANNGGGPMIPETRAQAAIPHFTVSGRVKVASSFETPAGRNPRDSAPTGRAGHLLHIHFSRRILNHRPGAKSELTPDGGHPISTEKGLHHGKLRNTVRSGMSGPDDRAGACLKQAGLDAGMRSDGLTSKEREELRCLRRENKQLRVEREILKKTAA